eukprot:9603714-Alexandrium_andersonii.AAC.1
MAECLGDSFGGIFWDLEKFYDDMSLAALVCAGIRRGYPGVPLVLSLGLCLAPRTLVLMSAASSLVWPSNSVLAGDAQANNMAKLVLYDLLERITGQFPATVTEQYVDDLSQTVVGSDSDVAR